jgi:LCP family protein required for cell wall assembly
MRLLFKALLLISLVVVVSACGSDANSIFFNPEISVTPATAPVSIPGVTPPAVSLETLADGSVVAVAPVRTPIRIKAPAEPVIPTETPTPPPTPEPVEAAETPTPLPLVVPTDTPVAQETEPQSVEQPTAEPAAVTRPLGLDHTLNILLVGSDERHADRPWRSDVVMVAAVDFANREVGIISFPRDLWVSIPTVGENRINTATFWGTLNKYPDGGGIGLLADTIERNFGIRIDHYAKINFESFKDLVDALGGIDVTVDCPIAGRFPTQPGSTHLVYKTLQPGTYHMDGFFALRYVRERKSTSDVDRNRRQQRVLIALRNRAREVNVIPRLPALYDAMRDSIETDLGLTDILALGRLGIQIDSEDAHGFTIGFKETKSWTTPAGASVLLPRMSMINDRIQHIFDEPSILKNPNKPRSCPKVE